MPGQLIDDCFRQDPRDKTRLSHDEVIAQLRARVSPLVGVRECGIERASGLVAAEEVVAERPVPGHTNAAVDGFAFGHASLQGDAQSVLEVVDRAAAGHAAAKTIAAGQAARIFTGAILPDGCDTVAMQEDCSIEPAGVSGGAGGLVVVPAGLKKGANVRKAGEDVAVGDVILERGNRIRPQDVAAMASVGRSCLRCYGRPSVAIVSTGDEVVRAGSGPLAPGQVFDTNAPMLTALAAAAGCTVNDLGILPDDEDAVISKMQAAADDHHIVLTSGGASQGEEDYIAHAIETLGTRHFWQIAVKPGRPLMLGQIDNTIVVGLPGNPVAVFVCFLMYVFPMLRRLGGEHWPDPDRFAVPAAFSVDDRKIGRREFWRGTLVDRSDGVVVEKFPRDGSGLISGLRAADGLIDVPENVPKIRPGDAVDFIPFAQFGIRG